MPLGGRPLRAPRGRPGRAGSCLATVKLNNISCRFETNQNRQFSGGESAMRSVRELPVAGTTNIETSPTEPSTAA
ncbi:hypothetical protein Q31a_57800 [Aureliella helgolandensis]|uniref:Uncharacterized protein n=1 Tax=Aureliella helgolandensis TaxID=2527968 RepID=A0A518GFL5_9BACT|nr:hypothetical protein Q31a_57800 [Aureliella helgolandensis]